MCTYPRPGRLLLACRLVVASWVLIPLSFAALFAGLAGLGPAEALGRTWMALVAAFVVVGIAELAIAWTLRCPACRRRVLIEVYGPFHPGARVMRLGGHYAPVVLDVLRRRRFTCMHCGHACEVDGAQAGSPAA